MLELPVPIGPEIKFLPKDECSRDDFEETVERFEVGRNDKVKDFPMLLLAYVSLRFPTAGGYKCEK